VSHHIPTDNDEDSQSSQVNEEELGEGRGEAMKELKRRIKKKSPRFDQGDFF
jgi:hypothetical protein